MLQEIRTNKKMSQKELAEKSGLNLRTIQHYEQKERNINGAKLETLIILAKALECKISDIVDDENLVNKCKEIGI